MAQTSKANQDASDVSAPRSAESAWIGGACHQELPCADGLACLSLYSDGQGAYPEGMCSTICPKDTCPDGNAGQMSYCVQWPHENEALCLLDCSTTRRCEREGYTCARLQRSDSSRMRHVCVPKAESARETLQKLQVNGTPVAPQSTVTLDQARAQWKGSPVTFQTAHALLASSSPNATRDEDVGSVRENDTNINATLADAALAHGQVDDAAAPALNGSKVEGPEEDARQERATGADASANENTDEAASLTAGEQAPDVLPDTPRASKDTMNWVSVTIIAVVGLITVLTLLRMIFSGRVGGLMRSVRDAAGEETPLERIRRLERKKRVHGPRPEAPPDVRLERRRSPVRPLRSIPNPFDEEHDDVPVLSRDDAIARAIIAPTPAPPPDEPEEETLSDDTSDAKTAAAPEETAPPEEPKVPVTPAFSADDLRTFSTLKGGPRARIVEREEVSDGASILGTTPLAPTHEENQSVQRWARANAARTFRANKVAPSVDENTRLKDMDEFVAPLPIDIVLQLLDALLDHAEAVRQRKGYDAIVYIETDPEKTIFQRGPEGEIRIQHAPDALAKPILAVDAMRRKGFSSNLKVPDAHLLSLVHLGRYLLGSAAPDDVITDIDALSSASGRFSDEELQLMRYLLAPEEHAHLQHLAMSRGRSGGFVAGAANATDAILPPAPLSPQSVDWLPCPDCASEVHVGDLACAQCGTALHPRPAFCPSCGSLNLLFADGRAQGCANISCDQELLVPVSGADAEGRRLSIVAGLLSSFEEFRKLPAPGNVEHYEAYTQGRRVEIWQIPQDRAQILLEDDRPHYALGDVFTLPHRCVEQSGVRFVIYDPPATKGHPLHSLGPAKLAEGLLLLWDEVHRAKLRAPTLSFEDLSVSEAGDVLLLHGHVLREATAATPRIRDTRFMAPELARQAIATERSDLYTLAAIWKYALSGQLPTKGGETLDDDAFIGASELALELMAQCLREEASDRPPTVRYVLNQLRERRRLSDLI